MKIRVCVRLAGLFLDLTPHELQRKQMFSFCPVVFETQFRARFFRFFSLLPVIQYPAAFTIYRSHCQRLLSNPEFQHVPSPTADKTADSDLSTGAKTIRSPQGSALLIPPQEKDYKNPAYGKKHWIVCLFTSGGFGRRRSSSEVILSNTVLAVRDMKEQLERLREGHDIGNDVSAPTELWSCRFNSGLFGVPWERSRKVLVDEDLQVTVALGE